MTSAVVLTPSALVSIRDFLVDVALNEDYSFDSDVTDFPVESGSSIVDNIRPKPIVVRIEGIISNTPIGNVAQARQSAGTGGSGKGPTPPTDDAYDTLLDIRDKREPVTITTSLRTYENMALQSLSVPRATGRGDELRFNATFKQVVIVQNKRTMRVATPGGISNHTKSGAPKPVGDPTTAGVMMIQIFRIPSYKAESTPGEAASAGQYLWFDPDMSGWRFGVRRNTSGDTRGVQYEVFRKRPWGVSQSEWASNPKTTAQYRQDIAAAYASPKRSASAPYTPFTHTKIFVPFFDRPGQTSLVSDVKNVQIVQAFVVG